MIKPKLEILSQGEEIICGQIADTNAAWLSQAGMQLGFLVTRHTTVGDKLDDLVVLLKEIAARTDCCLCTGGLGPTTDDLTAEAVSIAFDLPLVFDEIAYAQIEAFFVRRKRTMPESNRKQALLPHGAMRLDNEIGTAPGFCLQTGRCFFAFMPGVPSEMQHIYSDRITPLLKQKFYLQPDRLMTIKTVGIGESTIQELINPIALPTDVGIGYRASVNEVQIKLLFAQDYSEQTIQALTQAIAEPLGHYVFAIEDSQKAETLDLLSVIDKLMTNQNLTLVIQETASHGLMSSMAVAYPWLRGSTCIESPKHQIVGNDWQTQAHAQALNLKALDTDCVLVQLFMDNASGFYDKNQTSIVYIYLLTPDSHHVSQHLLSGTVTRKQNQSALLSFDLLRRYLQNCVDYNSGYADYEKK